MLAYVLHVGMSGSGYGSKNKLGEDHSVYVFFHTLLSSGNILLKNITILLPLTQFSSIL